MMLKAISSNLGKGFGDLIHGVVLLFLFKALFKHAVSFILFRILGLNKLSWSNESMQSIIFQSLNHEFFLDLQNQEA